MYLFECEATFKAEPDEVWKVWTDVARWPEWDVGKEIAQQGRGGGRAGPLIRLFAPRMRRDTAASLAVLQKRLSH